ncbi:MULTISPECIES: hypothetical protein [Clostridia]|uniref:hypothetical protein n=1 Tax=Clostridia TaxID=186801 RepID=UPI001FAA59F6|nr:MULTISPECIES: hypothetical protein [Clostridia]
MVEEPESFIIDVSKPHTTIIRVEKNEGATKIFSTEKANFSDDEVHDMDSPKVKRKDVFVKNSMWTINEKIIDEAKKGKK